MDELEKVVAKKNGHDINNKVKISSESLTFREVHDLCQELNQIAYSQDSNKFFVIDADRQMESGRFG